MNKKRLLIANCIAVFAIAFALTTFLHELAHAITAKLLHAEPILFHTYVSYDTSSVPEMDQMWIAAAGPVFSLIQSTACLLFIRRRDKFNLYNLMVLWLGVMGLVVLLGYIMMGPFVPYGDTGKIYSILSVPSLLSIGLAFAALAIMIRFFRAIPPTFGDFMAALAIEDHSKAVQHFFVLPIAIGTIINVLISLPAPTPMSLAFPMVISLTLVPSAVRLGKTNIQPSPHGSFKPKYWPIVSLLALVILSRLLAGGIHI